MVVLLLEGKDTKLLVVELQALQHCIQTTGGLVQQKVPFSVFVQVLQDSQNGFLLVHLQLKVLLCNLRLKLHELSHVSPHHIISKRGTVVESFFCQLSSQLGSHFWSLGLSIGARKTILKGSLGL